MAWAPFDASGCLVKKLPSCFLRNQSDEKAREYCLGHHVFLSDGAAIGDSLANENEFILCRELATKTLEQCRTENNTHNND